MASKVTVSFELIDRVSKQAGKIARTLGAIEKNSRQADRAIGSLASTQDKDMARALDKVNRLLEEQDKLITKVRKQSTSQANRLKKEFASLASSRTKENNARRKQIKSELELIKNMRSAAEAVAFMRTEISKRIKLGEAQQAEKSAAATRKFEKALKDAKIAIADTTGAMGRLEKQQSNLQKQTDNIVNVGGKRFVNAQKLLKQQIDDTVISNNQLNKVLRDSEKALVRAHSQIDTTKDGYIDLSNEIKRQVSEIRVLSNAIRETNDTYRAMRRDVDAATPALSGFRKQFNTVKSSVFNFVSGRGQIQKAFREAFDFSFFRSGVVMGLDFFATQTKILGLLPIITVAVGGLASAFGSLGAGITMAAGSLTRLIGGLAILPGMYAALGAGFLGVQNIFTGFITPSVNGAKQLEGMSKQISAAQGRLAKAKQDVAAAQEPAGGPVSFGEAMQGKFGMAAGTTDTSKAESALEAQKQAQQQLTDLTQKQSKLLEKMPKDYQKIADAIKSLQEAWKNFFQGGTRGAETTKVILDTVNAITAALGEGSPLIKVAEEYVKLYQDIGGAIQAALDPKSGNLNIITTVWLGAVKNARKFVELMRVLAPYIAQALIQLNKFTGKVLDAFTNKVRTAKTDSEEFGQKLDEFLTKAYNSWDRLFESIGNVVNGFQNLIDKTKDTSGLDAIDRLEFGLISLTQRFEDWTAKVSEAKVNAYFNNSIEILKSIGRVLLSVAKAFGGLVADDAAAASTVNFFNFLSDAIERFGGFMKEAVGSGLGDKMTSMLQKLLDAFSGKGGGIIRAVERTIDLLNGLIKVFDMMPPWVLEFVLTLRLGMGALGFTLGSLMAPLANLAGGLFKVGKAFGFVETAGEGANKVVRVGSRLYGYGAKETAKQVGGDIKSLAKKATSPKTTAKAFKGGAGKAAGAIRGSGKVARVVATEATGVPTAARTIAGVVKAPARAARGAKWGAAMAQAEGGGKAKQVIGAVKGIGSSLGTFSKLAKVFGAMRGLIAGLFSPIGLVISAFTALATNAMGVRDRLVETFKTVGGPLISAFKGLFSALGFGGKSGKGGFFSDILKALNFVMDVVGVGIVEAFRVVVAVVTPFLTFFVRYLTVAVNYVNDLWKALKKLFKGDVKGFATGVGDAIMNGLKGIWGALKDMFSQLFNGLFGPIIDGVLKAMSHLPDWAGGKWAKEQLDDRKKAAKLADEEAKAAKDHQKAVDGVVKKYKTREAISAQIKNNEAALNRMPLGVRRTETGESLRRQNLLLEEARKKAPNAVTTQEDASMTVQKASELPGVTSGPRGATVKWDMKSVQQFTGQMGIIEADTKSLIKTITKLVNHIRDYPMKNLKTIMLGWKLLGNQIYEALHDALVKMEKELNNALAAMNVSPVDFSKGSSQTSTVSSSTGSSNRSSDSVMGSGLSGSGIASGASMAATASGNIWGGHPALSGAIADFVSQAVQSGLQVTATTDHSKYTSSGNVSNHYLGQAADVSNGTAPTPEMDAFYQKMVPYAQSGALKELIYKHYGWSNGSPYTYSGTDHFNHVHIAAAGAGGLTFDQMAAVAISDPGVIGKGALGGLATAIGQAAYNAATNMTSASGGFTGAGEHGTYSGNHQGLNKATPETAQAYARSVLNNYGWGPNQMSPLMQLWNQESGWRWNADNPSSDAYGIPQALPGSRMASFGNDWLTNAGTQVDWGLWYIKQGANTTKAKPGGGYGSPSDALAAKNSTSPHWYGNGGSFTAKKPMMIGVGDKQPEEVRVTPTRGPNKGKYSGGKTTVVNSTINLGTLIANESGIEMLTEEIGKQIRKDVNAARRAKPVKDE